MILNILGVIIDWLITYLIFSDYNETTAIVNENPKKLANRSDFE